MKFYGSENASISIEFCLNNTVSIGVSFERCQFDYVGVVDFVYSNKFGVNVKFKGKEGVAFIGKLPIDIMLSICGDLAKFQGKTMVYDGNGMVSFKSM